MLHYTCFGYLRKWDMVNRTEFYLQDLLSHLLFDTQAPFLPRQLCTPTVTAITPSSVNYLFPVEFQQVWHLQTNLFICFLDPFIQYLVQNDIKLRTIIQHHSTKVLCRHLHFSCDGRTWRKRKLMMKTGNLPPPTLVFATGDRGPRQLIFCSPWMSHLEMVLS